MFLLRFPSEQFINSSVDSQRNAEFTYLNVGWTRSSRCPVGFAANQWTAVVAQGGEGFERAKNAFRTYQMLQLGWLRHVGPKEPIQQGSLVCTLARQTGIYSLNVARIVYVDNESPNRFGFGYGTLPEYPLCGEERFTVEIDENTGEVSYEIFSFSRPKSLLTALGRPIIRGAQRRFCRDSVEAMRAACHE